MVILDLENVVKKQDVTTVSLWFVYIVSVRTLPPHHWCGVPGGTRRVRPHRSYLGMCRRQMGRAYIQFALMIIFLFTIIFCQYLIKK